MLQNSGRPTRALFLPTGALVLLFLVGCSGTRRVSSPPPAGLEHAVQADAVLTVAESKRLIAKAVARMPVVQDALKHGMVIVCKGTTNTYVAEELLGHPIAHGSYVIGRITPRKGGRPLPEAEPMSEVVLVKGQHRPELTLDKALEQVRPGDVIIKGGNALDYSNKTVAVWTGSSTGGTTGKILPHVGPGKAHLVVPVGLEKQIAGRVSEVVEAVNGSVETIGTLPRMRVLPGEIVTELEGLRILADVQAFQASAGGIGGAEGAVWLVWRGSRPAVENAAQIVAGIQGEPPFGARPDSSGAIR